MLKEIRHAVQEHRPEGIAFLRGGGGGSSDETLRIWNSGETISELLALGIPIYSAIGHSHQLLLIDKYADESFVTPTDFGNCLRDTVKELEGERALTEKKDRLQGECLSLTQQVNISTTSINSLKSYYRSGLPH